MSAKIINLSERRQPPPETTPVDHIIGYRQDAQAKLALVLNKSKVFDPEFPEVTDPKLFVKLTLDQAMALARDLLNMVATMQVEVKS